MPIMTFVSGHFFNWGFYTHYYSVSLFSTSEV